MRLLGLLLMAGSLAAQQDWTWTRHNFTIGGGAGRPRGDISPALADSPALAIGYGYRFHPNFQADIGLDTIFGAAGVNEFVNTGFGFTRISDYQILLPFGGRAILPFDRGRILLSGGGGGAWMHYFEHLHQPSYYYVLPCYTCTSRGGWGYYALAALSTSVDRNQHFRLGVTAKMYRGFTNGEPIGGVPGVRTKDRWLVVSADFGFCF